VQANNLTSFDELGGLSLSVPSTQSSFSEKSAKELLTRENTSIKITFKSKIFSLNNKQLSENTMA
jgi:hypothetical protein